MKVKVHNNTVIHPSHAVCLVTPESSWLVGPCRMRGVIRNNSVFHVSYSRLALSLLCFFRALHQFFSGCELWRGASLSLLTLATQGLTKLREKKIPAFHCMNRSPAASPLGEAQQWLHFKNGQTGRVCWPETAQDPSGDLKQSDKENKGAKLHWHHYGEISVEEKFYCQ